MATDVNLLRGEVSDRPEDQELQVEKLLFGFLRSLLEEQGHRRFETEAAEASSKAGESL